MADIDIYKAKLPQDDTNLYRFRDGVIEPLVDTSYEETDYANPLMLETLQAQTAKNTKIKINPIQDLHGYDKPWVGGAGKNLLHITVEGIKAANTAGTWSGNVYTISNLTFTILTDSDNNVTGIKANGTNNSESQIIFNFSSIISVKAGSYKCGLPNPNFTNSIRYRWSMNGWRAVTTYAVEVTITSDMNASVDFAISNGESISNIILYPILCLSSDYDDNFYPYTNIASISGHDQIDILGCGKNLANVEFEQGAISSNTGQSYSNCKVSNNTRIRCKNLIALNPNIDYTLKLGNANYRYVIQTFNSQQLYYTESYSNQWTDTDITFSGAPYIAIAIKKSDESDISVSEYAEADIKLLEQDSISNLSINLPSTVYGGVLDLESGELVVDKKLIDLGDIAWSRQTFSQSTVGFLSSEMISDLKSTGSSSIAMNAICSNYAVLTGNVVYGLNIGISQWSTGRKISIYDPQYSSYSGTDFQTAMDGVQLCYELATPFTLYISSEHLKLLKEQNNLATSQYTQVKVTYRNGVFATLEELSDTANGIYDEISGDATTVSGNPINFTTREKQKSKSTIIDFEPIQDLHGFTKPWIGGAGKNKIPMTVDVIKTINTGGTWNGNAYTINNITFTVLTDNDNNIIGIKANGTPNANTNFYVNRANGSSLLSLLGSNTSYILNGCPSGGSATSYYLRFAQISPWSAIATDIGNGLTYSTSSITDSSSTQYAYIIGVDSGTTVNNIIFYPMIRLASVTDSIFEPYSNIASISGRSSVDIEGCGKNLIESVENGTWTTANQGKSASTNRARSIKLIMVKSSTQYCISAKSSDNKTIQTIAQFYSDIGEDTFISETSGWENVSRLFITPENCKYIAIIFRTSNNDNNPENYMSEAQLEENNQPSLYEPYVPSTDLTIAFGTTVYGGKLDVEKGELVVNKAIVDLGDLSWSYYGVYQTHNLFYSDSLIPDIAHSDQTKIYTISSAYTSYPNNTDPMPNGGLRVRASDGRLYINDDRYSDVTTFTNAVNDVQLVYELAIPQIIQLTPQQVQLLKGINNISTTGTTITVTFKNGSVAHLDDLPENAFTDLDKEKLASIDTLAVTLDLLTHAIVVTQDI